MNAQRPTPAKKSFLLVIRILFLGCLLVVLYFAFTGLGGLINRPHRPDATLRICTELEQAVQRFYDDNGTMPAEISGDATYSSNSPEGLEMLRVLFDQEVSDHPLSAKSVKYGSIREANGDKVGKYRNGLVYSEDGTKVIGLYDSWGGPIMIRLDGDFDESIEVQPKAQKEPRTLQRRVAVWSDGKDGVDGVGKTKDDVTTW